MKYFVYILRCANDALYTGITNDIERRLEQHNGLKPGGAKYTRANRPVALVYAEECSSRSDALKRELEIKELTRDEKTSLIQSTGKKV